MNLYNTDHTCWLPTRSKILLPLFGAIVLGVGAASFIFKMNARRSWETSIPRWTPKQLESQASVELPSGTSQEAVKRWLSARSIEYRYVKDPRDSGGIGNQTIPEVAGVPLDQISIEILGEIRESHADLGGVPGRIYLYFFFGNNGKLINHYIWAYNVSL